MSIHLMEEPQNRGFVAFGNPLATHENKNS